jgi:hypothetical protein
LYEVFYHIFQKVTTKKYDGSKEMLKIDRMEQNVELNEEKQYYNINEKDYTLKIGEGNVAVLKTNPGKSLNNGINFGADPQQAEYINNLMIERLELVLINNKTIEYCMDIKVDWKLVDNKHILKTFLKALEIHKYKSGKVDFKIEKDKWIDKAELKGLKGYKKSRALKIYSKYEEQGLNALEGDLIRLELILGARALEQNKVENISDIEKAKLEIREFLGTMRAQIIKANRYSKTTVELIEKFIEELSFKSA